jgi:hypothetical protein
LGKTSDGLVGGGEAVVDGSDFGVEEGVGGADGWGRDGASLLSAARRLRVRPTPMRSNPGSVLPIRAPRDPALSRSPKIPLNTTIPSQMIPSRVKTLPRHPAGSICLSAILFLVSA